MLLLLLLSSLSLCIKIILVIVFIIIKFYVVTICFNFDDARLWRSLEVWQVPGDVKNKRNGGNYLLFLLNY